MRLTPVASVAAIVLAIASTVLIAAPASADTDPVSGLDYTVSGVDVTITGIGTSSTAVVIPATIAGDPVTEIGDNAFKNDEVHSVSIPGSVTTIGTDAFENDPLPAVTIPDSVTSIAGGAFLDDFLSSLTIPDSITSISVRAFSDNNIMSLTIPDSATVIGSDAFDGNELSTVTIPASVTEIDSNAFSDNFLTTAVFKGNAPTVVGATAFGTLPGPEVEFPAAATGFTTPTWNGYASSPYYAVPDVQGVSPSGGPEGGTTSVIITGVNFTAASAVDFGMAAATSFTVTSDTSLTATAPAGTGTVDITVTAPGGTSSTSAADEFTYIPAPTITSLSPNAGSEDGGTAVTITGTNFTGATAVDFGASGAATFSVISSTSIIAYAPGGNGTDDVTVTVPGGSSATSAADQFTYVPQPIVTAASPNSGSLSGGTVVTITGIHFSGATDVEFGGIAAATFTVNSPTSITATTPAGVGTVDVSITTTGGTGTGVDDFTYAVAPTIASVSPASGVVTGGTVVTITGSGFGGATAVTFGGVPAASFTVVSDASITATTPAGTLGTADVVVTGRGGPSTAASFTFTAVPPIVKILALTGAVAPWTGLFGAILALIVGAVLILRRRVSGRFSRRVG